jgi:hypothetical protein
MATLFRVLGLRVYFFGLESIDPPYMLAEKSRGRSRYGCATFPKHLWPAWYRRKATQRYYLLERSKVTGAKNGMKSMYAKVKHVSMGGGKLSVWLDDGRVFRLPLGWYPSLESASPAERSHWRKSCDGYGIHWPALDYDVGVYGLLTGKREARTILAHTRRFRARLQPARSPRHSAGQIPKR